jgi:phosphohistidine phosphatase SixA
MERLLSDLARRQVARVGLVGHQPALGRLLSWLISGDASATRIDFRKGSIACVDCGAMPACGRGELRWLLTPRALRALGTGH